MRKMNLVAAAVAALIVSAGLPSSATALSAGSTGTPPLAAPAVRDPSPPDQPDDFVRSGPPPHRVGADYSYVSAPLAGTLKTTLVTVQLADKSAAETDAAVPMAAVQGALSAAHGYWASMTVGRVDIATVNVLRLHKSAAKSTQSPAEIVDIVSSELGWTQSPYTALVMFVPGAYLSSGAAGMTYSNGTTGGRILMPQISRLSSPALTHEFGHALGLDHANSLQCGSGAMDVASGPYAGFADATCSIKPYGDNLDVMGIAHFDVTPQLSATLWEAGRFGNGDEISDLGIPSTPRSVTLRPWAGQGANRAAKFTDPKSGEVYFLELRAPVGYDAGVAQGGNRGVKITQQGAGNTSILLPTDTRPSAFNGYYSSTQAWQAGQTFVTHAGTHVSIDSVSDSAASVTISPPAPAAVGYTESVAINRSGDKASLDVSGWAYDSAKPSESSPVHIYVTTPDGVQTAYPITADQPRPDVNRIMLVSGNHGFSRSFDLTAAGTYRVCVYALASSAGPTDLGCRSLTLEGSAAPYGYFDSLSLVMANGRPTLRSVGWSYDPGSPSAQIPVHIYVTDPSGKTVPQVLSADQPRADVNSVMQVAGNHGFTGDTAVTMSGQYRVCAYGLAVTRFTQGNSFLGCKAMTPPVTPAPIGYLESVVANTGAATPSLEVRGWTLDPGTPAASIPVHVYVTDPDGATTSAAYKASQARDDVNGVMGTTGNHGYQISIPIKKPGTYRICSYGLAVSQFPLGNTLLGCQSVVAASTPAPIGYLDSVKVEGSSLVATGWAMDPAVTSASIPVHVYVTSPDGSTRGTAYVANGARADVNGVFQVAGDHGYTATIPVTQRGTYAVCAWGIGIAALSAGNTQFACKWINY